MNEVEEALEWTKSEENHMPGQCAMADGYADVLAAEVRRLRAQAEKARAVVEAARVVGLGVPRGERARETRDEGSQVD